MVVLSLYYDDIGLFNYHDAHGKLSCVFESRRVEGSQDFVMHSLCVSDKTLQGEKRTVLSWSGTNTTRIDHSHTSDFVDNNRGYIDQYIHSNELNDYCTYDAAIVDKCDRWDYPGHSSCLFTIHMDCWFSTSHCCHSVSSSRDGSSSTTAQHPCDANGWLFLLRPAEHVFW